MIYRGIAKLVRHWILNPACVGSSPATPAIEFSAVPTGAAFLLPKILNSVQGSCQSVSAIRDTPMGGKAMPMQARSRYYPCLADAKLTLRLRLAYR